ncbi:hypothetical protein ACDH60_28245, partial [Pseudomonas ficuserectae]
WCRERCMTHRFTDAASMRRHWKSTEEMTMQRFVVSTRLPKFYRDQGYRAEIIDRKYPESGGPAPVAIEWFKTKADADSMLAQKYT